MDNTLGGLLSYTEDMLTDTDTFTKFCRKAHDEKCHPMFQYCGPNSHLVVGYLVHDPQLGLIRSRNGLLVPLRSYRPTAVRIQ